MKRSVTIVWIVPVLIIGILFTAASTLEPERELVAQAGSGDEAADDEAGNDAVASISDLATEDGTYEGTAEGFHDEIRLSVTVEGGEIVDIDVISQSEREDLWEDVWATVPDEIISRQSTDVDTVSGATWTSEAVVEAVLAALDAE